MSYFSRKGSLTAAGISAAACALIFGLLFLPSAFGAEQQPATSPLPLIKAFLPGESLTYVVPWSGTVKIGTAVMEVKAERLSDGREVLRFVSTSRTEGLVGSLYPLGDTIQSGFDPADICPEHWAHIHNRLSANREPRDYTAERHAFWRARMAVSP